MKKLILFIAFAITGIASASATGIVATAIGVNPTCFGMCNGSANAMAAGGVGPYGFTWTGPASYTASGANITGLCAGVYIVTATDSSDMSIAVYTVSLTQPTLLTASAPAATACAGDCTPLTSSVSGGTAPYYYTWSPATDLSDPHVFNPTACPTSTETYTLTIVDPNMCTATATTTVTINPIPTVVATNNSPICENSSLMLAASSTAGATYSWEGPAGYIAVLQNPTIVNAPTLISGTFTVTVTVSGCTGSATTNVLVNPLPVISMTPHSTTCGMCNGSISNNTIIASTYIWSGPTSYSSTAMNPANLCVGTYTLTAANTYGCTASNAATVVSAPMYADYSIVPDSADGYTIHTFNTTSGSGNYYTWDFGDGTNDYTTSPTHLYTAPGTYTVCLQVASPSGGCYDTVCKSVVITGTPASCLALFNIGDDTTNADPNAFTVYNLSYGTTLSYSWNFGDGATSTQQNPTHVYPGMGPYQICLTVDNGSGCIQTYCDSIMSVDSLSRSNSLSFTVVDVPGSSLTTGISEQESKVGVNVYPNPFSDNTTFVIQSTKLNETYSFEMTDVLGKTVQSVKGISGKQFTVSRNDLQSGIYFYKIYSSGKNIGVGKLIIK
ncbi:MAG: hypothetical protein JWP12_2246 [Bacteroidetes bacterium]|nr:hypothetical protein [Bacteroidota bacterium]